MKTNRKQQPLPDTVGGSADPSPTGAPQAGKAGPPSRAANSKDQSKQDRVLGMLRRKDGTTIAAVMKVTGWQQHSVRGFLAGVVRKKLGLNLVSNKSDHGRTYRITAGKSANKAPAKRKRRA